MSLNRKILALILAFLGIILVPYIAGYVRYGGIFPEGYFDFPTLIPPAKAPFNRTIFILISIIGVAMVALYFFPRLFGFKRVVAEAVPRPPRVPLPRWFWLGLVMWAGTLAVMWSHAPGPKWLLNWADLPLFWGFTLVLDGWVYRRTGGHSIIADAPREIIGIGVASISGWLIFEFLNFFVEDTWVYPFGDMLPDDEFVIYAVLGSSGLVPMAFEWYSLLNTFPKFRARYEAGPRIVLPGWVKWVVFIASFAALAAAPFFPNEAFGVLWLAPLGILSVVLSWLGLWTPFTPVMQGNWAPGLIIALTYFIQCTLCECWNYFSAAHGADGAILTHNPGYWTYSLPYVNVLHVFEMPLLGLLGYLPFGVYCGIWWIAFAFLLNIPTRFASDGFKNV